MALEMCSSKTLWSLGSLKALQCKRNLRPRADRSTSKGSGRQNLASASDRPAKPGTSKSSLKALPALDRRI